MSDALKNMTVEFNLAQTQLKEKLEKERYYTINDSGKTDTFIRAWIMIRNGAAVGVSFFNKKRHVRDLNKYIDELHLRDYASASEEERKVYEYEYRQFAAKWIKMCYTDKNYSSVLFGMMRAKATTVTGRILDDINTVTTNYPSEFGLDSHFVELKNIMLEELEQMKSNYEKEDDE